MELRLVVSLLAWGLLAVQAQKFEHFSKDEGNSTYENTTLAGTEESTTVKQPKPKILTANKSNLKKWSSKATRKDLSSESTTLPYPALSNSSSKVVPKKSAELSNNNETLTEESVFSVVPKKGVGDFGSSPVVPKKGVGDEDDDEGIKNAKKVEYSRNNSSSTETVTTTPAAANVTVSNSGNSSLLHSAEVPESKEVKDDPTPNTSLLVGLVFGVLLLAVIGFLVYKRVDASRRRREYRRMNDFLIDGMYNDL